MVRLRNIASSHIVHVNLASELQYLPQICTKNVLLPGAAAMLGAALHVEGWSPGWTKAQGRAATRLDGPLTGR